MPIRFVDDKDYTNLALLLKGPMDMKKPPVFLSLKNSWRHVRKSLFYFRRVMLESWKQSRQRSDRDVCGWSEGFWRLKVEGWKFRKFHSLHFSFLFFVGIDSILISRLSYPLLPHRLINQYLILHSSATPKWNLTSTSSLPFSAT